MKQDKPQPITEDDFIIYKSKHLLIERDHIKKGKPTWVSFGIHFDWKKPHIIIYLSNYFVTIGNIKWGI